MRKNTPRLGRFLKRPGCVAEDTRTRSGTASVRREPDGKYGGSRIRQVFGVIGVSPRSLGAATQRKTLGATP